MPTGRRTALRGLGRPSVEIGHALEPAQRLRTIPAVGVVGQISGQGLARSRDARAKHSLVLIERTALVLLIHHPDRTVVVRRRARGDEGVDVIAVR